MTVTLADLQNQYASLDAEIPLVNSLYVHVRDHWASGDDQVLFAVSTGLAHLVPFYSTILVLGLIRRFIIGEDNIERHRVQPGKYPSKELIAQCERWVLGWHVAVFPLAYYALWPLLLWRDPEMFHRPVPGVLSVIIQAFLMVASEDTCFYWTHRLLHWGPLYRYIHKQHHRFTVVVGPAAEFAHPLELVFGGLFPTISGALIFGVHPLISFLFQCVALSITVLNHSGYSFCPDSATFHDFHHSANVGNYGSGFWDNLCGTDRAWREHLQKKSKKKSGDSESKQLPKVPSSTSSVNRSASSRRQRK